MDSKTATQRAQSVLDDPTATERERELADLLKETAYGLHVANTLITFAQATIDMMHSRLRDAGKA